MKSFMLRSDDSILENDCPNKSQNEVMFLKQPTKQEITNKLNDVIMGRISREDVSKWAMEYIRNDGDVYIEDVDSWHYLVAVSNIDEMLSPNEYLYSECDIINLIEEYQYKSGYIVELDKLKKYSSETDLIRIVEGIDDKVIFRGYTREQILCLANEIVKIDLLSVKYETREEILHFLCDALSYYDIFGSVSLTSIVKIKDMLEDDLKEYIEEFIDGTKTI